MVCGNRPQILQYKFLIGILMTADKKGQILKRCDILFNLFSQDIPALLGNLLQIDVGFAGQVIGKKMNV